MDIGTSRLTLRARNAWEALDLGVRLWAERKGLYIALWATFFLPLLLLLSLLFWRTPWWVALLLWWLKPMFEAPILTVLSEQVFVPAPTYRQCVAAVWRLLWRPRLLGDLLWRRFNPHRSLLLPMTVLERLDDRQHRLRGSELVRYGDGAAVWLSFFGIHFETILSYGLLIIVYWLWFGNPVENVLVQPASMGQVGETLYMLARFLLEDDALWLYHLSNLLYALVLCFWGPLYVAAGFGLYLHARTLSEAWDVRLSTHRLAARLNHLLVAVLVPCLGLVLLASSPPTQAESLPDARQVEQNRQAVLEQPPFPHLQNEKRYCWKTCLPTTEQGGDGGSDITMAPTKPTWLNVVLYGLSALLLLGVLWLFFRWWRLRRVSGSTAAVNAPETLFGLAITLESLPADVGARVMDLWPQDARAAVSLLYRASLVRLPDLVGIALKDSDTEGEVLRRVQHLSIGSLSDYWQRLTEVWLQLAYAHRLPAASVVTDLCCQYRQNFEPERGQHPQRVRGRS